MDRTGNVIRRIEGTKEAVAAGIMKAIDDVVL
jgi:hypothetical protein